MRGICVNSTSVYISRKVLSKRRARGAAVQVGRSRCPDGTALCRDPHPAAGQGGSRTRCRKRRGTGQRRAQISLTPRVADRRVCRPESSRTPTAAGRCCAVGRWTICPARGAGRYARAERCRRRTTAWRCTARGCTADRRRMPIRPTGPGYTWQGENLVVSGCRVLECASFGSLSFRSGGCRFEISPVEAFLPHSPLPEGEDRKEPRGDDQDASLPVGGHDSVQLEEVVGQGLIVDDPGDLGQRGEGVFVVDHGFADPDGDVFVAGVGRRRSQATRRCP